MCTYSCASFNNRLWRDELVAVKVLRQESGMLEEERLSVFEEFRREVAIMTELRHPNLVQLKVKRQ